MFGNSEKDVPGSQSLCGEQCALMREGPLPGLPEEGHIEGNPFLEPHGDLGREDCGMDRDLRPQRQPVVD